MKKLILLFLLLLISSAIFAQNVRDISGVVRDSLGSGVIYATVRLTSPRDTLTTRTDVEGTFNFSNVKSAQFVISINSLGYRDFVKRYLYTDATNPIRLDPIVLRSHTNVLKEVVISGAAPVVVKQDTVEYRASDFPVRENSVAEDVIKRLPGVEVDKDGNVTTEGKSITRVKVNGKDYFDGDLKTATQGLPADIIEKIQIVDDYGDQANITGIREGEPDKIINITIRPDRMKGHVLSGVVGGGNQERYQVSGTGQFMDNDRQLDARLNLNNTNSSPFNFGGGGRGFGGGGGGFRGGGGGNFGGFGNAGGISSTTAGGLNYRDDLSKKVAINGSYRFLARNTDAVANSFGTTTYQRNEINTTTFSDTESNISYHSANFNLEYALDSLNYFRVTPYFNISSNRSDALRNLIQVPTARPKEEQNTTSLSNSSSPSFGGNFIYNHRFKRLGRNFSAGVNLNDSDSDSDQDVRDEFLYYNPDQSFSFSSDSIRNIETSSKRFNLNTNITYSEPVGNLGRLDFGYNYSVSDYENSRITEVQIGEEFIRATNLSNAYDYSFITNRFSLNYRYDRQRLYNFTIGLTAQPTLLKGYSELAQEPTRKENFNLFPTARFSYHFGRTRSLTINYNGRSSEPSFNQIQPVRDDSNPLRPVVGNPDLNSAFTQSLNLRLRFTQPASGFFFNTGIFGNITNDQIARNLVRYDEEVPVGDTVAIRTIQETRYINTDGYYSTNMFYSFGKPFKERKYTLSLNGSVRYTNDVSFIDFEKNTAKNWSFNQSLRLQINPSQNVEIYPSIGYNRTLIDYTLTDNNDTRVHTWNYDLNGRLFFLKTFIVGFDISKNVNRGYRPLRANPLIINAYLEKQFFNRRGTLRLQGFDLKNEGTVLSVSQDANSVVNSQTNRLTRYFMATFSFRIQKYPGGVEPRMERGRDGGRERYGPGAAGRGNF